MITFKKNYIIENDVVAELRKLCLAIIYVTFIFLCNFLVLIPEVVKADESKPLLFLVAGQSNAKGRADKPSSIIVPSGVFWNRDKWVTPIMDPVYPAKEGSFCPAMAKVISDKTKRKVYIINVSVSGSSSNEVYIKNIKKSWSKRGRLRERAISIYKKAVSKIDEPFEFGGVIWLQGEHEARSVFAGNISLEDAQKGFIDVYRWLSNYFGKVFIIGIGYNGDTRYDKTCEQINTIIRKSSNKIDKCYFASNTPIKLRELKLMQNPINGRLSNPHYLIKGYDLIGYEVGNYIVSHIYNKDHD